MGFFKIADEIPHQCKEVTLHGLSIPEDKVISGQQMEHVARKGKGGVLLQLFSLGSPQVQTTCSFVPVQVQQLLEKYKELFAELNGLPPKRMQDHKIPLLPGQGSVCVRPYRYPHFQKSEIEKLVVEMLSSRDICASNSP